MPPPQTTHLCFLEPLTIYLASEHSGVFFAFEVVPTSKNAWSIEVPVVLDLRDPWGPAMPWVLESSFPTCFPLSYNYEVL